MANYESAARRAATRYGVDPDIFVAQLRQESGLRMGVTSPAGARDIAQFMPGTAKSYGVTLGDGKAADDLDGAARYMRDNLKTFGGDYRKALAAYNAGAGAVQKYGGVPPYAETQNYVTTILGNAGKSRGQPAPSPTGSKRQQGGQPLAVTVPGEDRSAERKALAADYFRNKDRDPRALLNLAMQLRSAQNGADTTTLIGAGGGGGGGGGGGASKPGRKFNILEEFWQGPGGVDVKNNQVVPQGFVSGHQDHVHVATGKKAGAIALGKLAKRMGLHVGENSYFDGGQKTTSGHAPNSYHYADQAIDVSGDSDLMRKFAQLVARKRRK